MEGCVAYPSGAGMSKNFVSSRSGSIVVFSVKCSTPSTHLSAEGSCICALSLATPRPQLPYRRIACRFWYINSESLRAWSHRRPRESPSAMHQHRAIYRF